MEVYGISELVGALAQRTRDVNRVIRKREYLEEFRNLWNADFSYYGDYYDLYRKVRKDLGLEPLNVKDFDFLFSVYTFCLCVIPVPHKRVLWHLHSDHRHMRWVNLRYRHSILCCPEFHFTAAVL